MAMMAGAPRSSLGRPLAAAEPPRAPCLQVAIDDPASASSLAQALASDPAADTAQRVAAADCLAHAQLSLGRGEAALASARQLLQLIQQHPELPGPLAQRARLSGFGVLAASGQPAIAEQGDVDIYLQALAGHDLPLQILALSHAGDLIGGVLRDPPTAVSYLDPASRLAQAAGIPETPLLYPQLQAAIDQNDAHRARQWLASLRRQEPHGLGGGAGLRLDTAEARIDLSQQLPLVALPLLQKVLPQQEAIQDRFGQRSTLLAMGLAELYQDHLADARRHTLQSLELAEEAHANAIPALHQLLDIAFKAQDQASIDRYGERLIQLGSRSERQHWKQSVQQMVARLGPPHRMAVQLAAYGSETPMPPPPDHRPSSWLAWLGLGMGCGGIGLALYQQRHYRQRLRISSVDPLCQVLTRGAASLQIDRRIAQTSASSPDQGSLVLMLVDVDHFKQINDRYGHVAGDAVLAEIAARLKRSCRDQDIIGRWGGEEFLIASYCRDISTATSLAGRICEAMAMTPVSTDLGHRIPVTVSIGAAWWPFVPAAVHSGHWQEALLPADAALYAVKRSGRHGWALIRGTMKAEGHTLVQLLQDPELQWFQGRLDIHCQRPLRWSPAPTAVG
ncbi:GGDEF domain-containing protein [Frateuria aurantia]